MKRNLGVTRSLVLTALCAATFAMGCGSTEGGAPQPGPVTTTEPTAPAGPLADDVAVNEIAVYQATKASIVKDGEIVPDTKINAPIIAGRPALVRVFVKALGNKRPLVEGELRVKRAGKEDLVLKDGGKRVALELDDELLENTLNFNIAAADLTADASFSFKVATKLEGAAPADLIAFPADGSALSFGAKTASKKLRVKFVPVSYEADEGVSITPDLADVQTLKDTLFKMYPVSEVEVTVREPLKWATPIKSNGPGWDELLSGIMQLRRADKAERDVYYVGIFTPKESLDQFCNQGGCILGMAPQASERDVNLRVALVLGYKSRSAGSTLAQELAHAMGRMHAPCGVTQAVDDAFPYGSGGIGVWGYDILTSKLINPGNRYRDFMSYCGPTWTSDYTYKGIYERMELLTKQQSAIDASQNGTTPPGTGGGMETETMQSFRVTADGAVHEGPLLDVIPGSDASDESVAVSYEGALGKVFATAKGRVRTLTGTGSRLILVPAAPAGASRARLAGIGATTLRQ